MAQTTAEPQSDPLWLTKARELVGLKEIVGSQHERKILDFFAEAGHPEIHDDETAWCAAFANAMLRRAGYAGTGALNARSFLNWGTKLSQPKLGCIVVFKRGNSSWQGHVAFFIADRGSTVEVLGGNQGNAVSITRMSKADVLGYRWPLIKTVVQKVPVPAPAKPEPKGKPSTDLETGAGAGGGVIIGTGATEAATRGAWFEVMVWLAIAVVFAIGFGLYIYRRRKGRWPWQRDEAPADPMPEGTGPVFADVPATADPAPSSYLAQALDEEVAKQNASAAQKPAGKRSPAKRSKTAGKKTRATKQPRKRRAA